MRKTAVQKAFKNWERAKEARANSERSYEERNDSRRLRSTMITELEMWRRTKARINDIEELTGEYERARQCRRDIWDHLRFREGKTIAEAFKDPLFREAAESTARAKTRLARRRGHK